MITGHPPNSRRMQLQFYETLKTVLIFSKDLVKDERNNAKKSKPSDY